MKFNKATKNLNSELSEMRVNDEKRLDEYGGPRPLDNTEAIIAKLLAKLRPKYKNKKLTEKDISDIQDEVDDEFMGAYDYSVGDYDDMKNHPVNQAVDSARFSVLTAIGEEFGIDRFIHQDAVGAYGGVDDGYEEGDSIEDEFGTIW